MIRSYVGELHTGWAVNVLCGKVADAPWSPWIMGGSAHMLVSSANTI